MIQRIQSIFLLAIVICMTVVLFVPIWEKAGIGAEYTSYSASLNVWNLTIQLPGNTVTQATWYLAILNISTILIALTSIFSFKNRLKQIKLNALNSLFFGILVVGEIYLIISKGVPSFETANDGDFGIGFYLLIASMLLNLLANRFIRKDEALVRAADRIR